MANISELKQFGYKQRTVYKTTKQRNSEGSIITIDTPVGYTYHKTYDYANGWCKRKVSVKEVSGIWKVTYTFGCRDGLETFELENPLLLKTYKSYYKTQLVNTILLRNYKI